MYIGGLPDMCEMAHIISSRSCLNGPAVHKSSFKEVPSFIADPQKRNPRS